MGAGTEYNKSKEPKPPCEDLADRHQADPYDAKVAEELINSSYILQFTFQQTSGYLYVIHLPGRIAETPGGKSALYAKGWLPCSLLKEMRSVAGMTVNVATCKAESIYSARSTYGHGLTWRSTVINGFVNELTFEKKMGELDPVTDEDVKDNEKLWALRQIVNRYIPNQWEHTRTPVKKEVDEVLVLRVDIIPDKSHVHVRHGISKFEPDWQEPDENRYWQGSIPIWEAYGDPFYGRTEVEFPPRLQRFFAEKNRKNMAYATVQAGTEFKKSPPKQPELRTSSSS